MWTIGQIMQHEFIFSLARRVSSDRIVSAQPEFNVRIRACSYGQKLSRLARKLFDKFTSEISPCYENNMKSYIAFIWDEKFSRVPRSRLLTGEISVTGIMLFSYEHNFPA
jgi:hypothetical protein